MILSAIVKDIIKQLAIELSCGEPVQYNKIDGNGLISFIIKYPSLTTKQIKAPSVNCCVIAAPPEPIGNLVLHKINNYNVIGYHLDGKSAIINILPFNFDAKSQIYDFNSTIHDFIVLLKPHTEQVVLAIGCKFIEENGENCIKCDAFVPNNTNTTVTLPSIHSGGSSPIIDNSTKNNIAIEWSGPLYLKGRDLGTFFGMSLAVKS